MLTGPHVPLRLRLALLLALCAGTTALFGVAAVVVAGLWFEPARVRTEAIEFAGTLAYALEVPLAFDDHRAARETLEMLRARSDVRSATVYDTRGRQVAQYIGPGGAAAPAHERIFGTDLVVEKIIGP